MNHVRRRVVGVSLAAAAGIASITVAAPHADAQGIPIPASHCSDFSASTPTITMGWVGNAVKRAQCDLVHAGYSVGASGIDGRYGTATRTAVLKFQRAHHLAPDDIVGRLTWAQLNRYNTR